MPRALSLTAAAATATLLLAAPAPAFDIGDMTEAERQTFRSEIRDYLLENPEVLMEAIAVLEQRQASQQVANDEALVEVNADEIYDDGFSYVGGNPDGDVTLVEFLDYRCGYCRRAHPEVAELLQSDGNIRLIVKEFPILGDQSTLSSRFAVSVRQLEDAETYKRVSDHLMTFRGRVTVEALRRVAEEFGLDADQVMGRMNSEEVTSEIAATRELAQRLQITGTPTFVLGGSLVRGYVPLDAMREMVAAAREGEG